MENIFKVGDRVYNSLEGWGKIVTEDRIHPIVLWDKGDQGYCPTIYLSFTEYTLQGFSQDRPEVLPNRGDIVWGRNRDDQDWCIYHFNNKTYDGFYALSADNSDNAFILKQITTINPYANEQ